MGTPVEAYAVDVAAACSLRQDALVIDALLPSVAGPAGRALFVPVPTWGARLVVTSDRAGAVFIDGARGRAVTRDARDVDAATLDADGPRRFLVEVPGPDAVTGGGALATFRVAPDDGASSSSERSIVSAALSLPRPLARAPEGLRVVFVVDTSVSMGDAGVARALALVGAFLDEAPDDVGYAIVSAQRAPRVLVSPWHGKHARGFPAIRLENGSDLPRAVAKARTIARDAPPGAGRVVVLSDLQLAHGADVTLALPRTSAPGDPLVHVVEWPSDTDPLVDGLTFDRVFASDEPLAAVVEATGGVRLAAYQVGDDDARALARHLVRPTRLDRPNVVIDGRALFERTDAEVVVRLAGPVDTTPWSADARADTGFDPRASLAETRGDLPLTLDEGHGVRVAARLPGHAHRGHVEGLLWALPVSFALDDTGAARRVALATVANDDLASTLDDDEVRAIAGDARVVTRVTALEAIPSWRPAEPDLVVRGSGCSCGGSFMSGRFGTSCRCGGASRGGPPLETEMLLHAIIGDASARCGSARPKAATIELGDQEILDVALTPADACVARRLWAVRLDRRGHDRDFEPHVTLTITDPPRPRATTGSALPGGMCARHADCAIGSICRLPWGPGGDASAPPAERFTCVDVSLPSGVMSELEIRARDSDRPEIRFDEIVRSVE